MAVPGPGSGSSVVVGGTWPGPPVSMEGQQQLTGAARLGHYETRCCCCDEQQLNIACRTQHQPPGDPGVLQPSDTKVH